MTLDAELLKLAVQETKSEAGIFWEDDDKRIERYVQTAYKWLLHFNDDEPWLFDENSEEFTLITQRARYQYNNALDLFEPNYNYEINRISVNLARYKERTKNATTT